jgi:hypothetical protein
LFLGRAVFFFEKEKIKNEKLNERSAYGMNFENKPLLTGRFLRINFLGRQQV